MTDPAQFGINIHENKKSPLARTFLLQTIKVLLYHTLVVLGIKYPLDADGFAG